MLKCKYKRGHMENKFDENLAIKQTVTTQAEKIMKLIPKIADVERSEIQIVLLDRIREKLAFIMIEKDAKTLDVAFDDLDQMIEIMLRSELRFKMELENVYKSTKNIFAKLSARKSLKRQTKLVEMIQELHSQAENMHAYSMLCLI